MSSPLRGKKESKEGKENSASSSSVSSSSSSSITSPEVIATEVKEGMAEALEAVPMPDDYLCPILQDIMHDPVVAADGRSYERAAITDWIQRGHRESPLTGKPLTHTILTPNITLKGIIQEFEAKLPEIQRNQQIQVDMKLAIELREKFVADLLTKQKIIEQDKERASKEIEEKLKAEKLRNQELEDKIKQMEADIARMKLKQPASQLQTASANSASSSSSSSSVTSGISFFVPVTSSSVSTTSSSSVASIGTDKTGTKIPPPPSIASLKEAALKGDADAQAKLGDAYLFGDYGVTKDVLEATKWLKLAAQQTNTPAGKCAQGICYAQGLDVKEDKKKAVELFGLAAEQNYAPAQFNLGCCFENGIGITEDEVKAVALYRLAAAQGLASAQNNLGICFANGIGITKNEVKAVELYRLATEQGNACAQCNLGGCFEEGKGVAKDEKKAVELYRLAAEQNNADAQYRLGECYAQGTGVARNWEKAKELYQLAAEQGDFDAKNMLYGIWEAENDVIES